jgi:predicted aldo/keto reductase-like oxidoreductase
MLRHAIDRGVNYLDLPYLPDAGQREGLGRRIGLGLKGGYREKIKIAAELPAALIESGQDIENYLQTQLKLLNIDELDFFLITKLDRQSWPGLPLKDTFRLAEGMIAGGRLGHLGFAFHDDYQTLRGIIEAYDNWTVVQFQYSFMDVDHHPGAGGVKYAAEKGLAVVAAEPLKSGRLAVKLPGPVKEIWKTAPDYSPAGWAMLWLWNQPEVATAVSDMSSLSELKENIALADSAAADSLGVPEELLINRVRDAYLKLKPVPCTGCRGCMPCPRDIDVPRVFELYNDAVIYDNPEIPRSLYREEGHRIEECNACGVCEKACGRHIPISEWLQKIYQVLK